MHFWVYFSAFSVKKSKKLLHNSKKKSNFAANLWSSMALPHGNSCFRGHVGVNIK